MVICFLGKILILRSLWYFQSSIKARECLQSVTNHKNDPMSAQQISPEILFQD
jgi:hypothetical protein